MSPLDNPNVIYLTYNDVVKLAADPSAVFTKAQRFAVGKKVLFRRY